MLRALGPSYPRTSARLRWKCLLSAIAGLVEEPAVLASGNHQTPSLASWRCFQKMEGQVSKCFSRRPYERTARPPSLFSRRYTSSSYETRLTQSRLERATVARDHGTRTPRRSSAVERERGYEGGRAFSRVHLERG